MNIIVCLQQTQQYYLRRSREDIIQNIEIHVRFHIKLLWHIKNPQLILANSPGMYITKLVDPIQLVVVKYVQMHNQELLNMIHGRQPEVNGEISLSNLLAHLQQDQNRKNVSFILKNLIILDLIVQDRLFLQRLSTYYNTQLIYIQAQQGTATNKLATSIRDLIASYYIYIKQKSKYYLMQSPNIQQPAQREQYLQSSNSLTMLNQINICFKIQNLILDVNSKYRNRDKSLELVEFVFNLLLKTYLFCHSIVAIALKIFVKRIPELSKYDLEYVRKFVNYYNTNYIQNFNNFILSNQYIKSYQLVQQQKQVVLEGEQFKQSQPDTNIQQTRTQNKVEGAIESINSIDNENREGSKRKVGKKLSLRQSQQKIIQIIDQQIKNVQMNSTPIPEVQKAPKIQNTNPSNAKIQSRNQFRKSSSDDDEQKQMKLEQGYGELRVENKQGDGIDHKSSHSGKKTQQQLEEKLFELTKSMQYKNINFDSITHPKYHSAQDSGNKIESSRSFTHKQGRDSNSSSNVRNNQARSDNKMIYNQKQINTNGQGGTQTFDIGQAIDYADEVDIDQNYQSNKINNSIQNNSGDITNNHTNINSASKNDINDRNIRDSSHRINQGGQTGNMDIRQLGNKNVIVDINTENKEINKQQLMQATKAPQRINDIIITQQDKKENLLNNTANINGNDNQTNTVSIEKLEDHIDIIRPKIWRKKSTITNTDDKDIIQQEQAKDGDTQPNLPNITNRKVIDSEVPATSMKSIKDNIDTKESAPHAQMSNGSLPILTESKQVVTSQEQNSKSSITTQKIQQINAHSEEQDRKNNKNEDKEMKIQLKQKNLNQKLIASRNEQIPKVLDTRDQQQEQQLKTSLQIKVQERLNKQKQQIQNNSQIQANKNQDKPQQKKAQVKQQVKQPKQMDKVFEPINIEQQKSKSTILNNQTDVGLVQKSIRQQKRIQETGPNTNLQNPLKNQKALQISIPGVQHQQKEREGEIQVNQQERLGEKQGKVGENEVNQQQIYFKQYINCYSDNWEKSEYFSGATEENGQQTANQFLNPLQIAQYFNKDLEEQPEQDQEQEEQAEQEGEQQEEHQQEEHQQEEHQQEEDQQEQEQEQS